MAEILAVLNSASNGVKTQIDTTQMNAEDLKEAKEEEGQTGVSVEIEIEATDEEIEMVDEEKILAEIVVQEGEDPARETDPRIDLYLSILVVLRRTSLKIKTGKMVILAEDLPFLEMMEAEVQEGLTHETEMVLIGEEHVANLETIPPLFVVLTTAETETETARMIGDVEIMIGAVEGIEIEGGEEEIVGEIEMKGDAEIRGEIEEIEMKMLIDQKVRRESKARGKNRFHRKIDVPKIVKGKKKK